MLQQDFLNLPWKPVLPIWPAGTVGIFLCGSISYSASPVRGFLCLWYSNPGNPVKWIQTNPTLGAGGTNSTRSRFSMDVSFLSSDVHRTRLKRADGATKTSRPSALLSQAFGRRVLGYWNFEIVAHARFRLIGHPAWERSE